MTAAIEIAPVVPARVPLIWPMVRPWFEKALAKSESLHTLYSIRSCLESSAMQLWTIFSGGALVASFVTEVVASARGNILSVVVLGGERMSKWFAQFDTKLQEIGRLNECRLLLGSGRPGWRRWLSRFGWHEGPVTMLKGVV